MTPHLHPQDVMRVLLAVVFSIVLYYSVVGTFFFAVPVQVVLLKYKENWGLLAAGMAAGIILLTRALQAIITSASIMLFVIDGLVPIGILAGLLLFNMVRNIPWWIRMLLSTCIALLAVAPSLRAFMYNNESVREQVQMFLFAFDSPSQTDMFVETVRKIVFNTIGIGIMTSIMMCWWIGTSIVARQKNTSISLRGISLPDKCIWAVIGGLGMVVLTRFLNSTMLGILGWNILLITAMFFAVQGMGIIQHFVWNRSGGSVRAERMVIVFTPMLLLVPVLNIIVILGLPLLGVSEIWLDYKREGKYEGNTE